MHFLISSFHMHSRILKNRMHLFNTQFSRAFFQRCSSTGCSQVMGELFRDWIFRSFDEQFVPLLVHGTFDKKAAYIFHAVERTESLHCSWTSNLELMLLVSLRPLGALFAKWRQSTPLPFRLQRCPIPSFSEGLGQ